MELAPQEGLVTASASAQSQATVSSLILRIESLRAQNLLTHDQATMLRTLAWSKDFTLLKTYERARGFADPGLCKELTSRLGFLRRPGLHVVHIAVEMHPIVKVGRLWDTSSGALLHSCCCQFPHTACIQGCIAAWLFELSFEQG